MQISWNWLSEWVDLQSLGSPDKLADLLTQRGLEVEKIINQSSGFEQVVTAKVISKNKHPNADRLSLCQVTMGKGENLSIVCGAKNMEEGDVVALAQVGAELPNGMKISQGKIRGEVSFGMLCSEVELGLSQESEGILILSKETPLGLPLAQVLGKDDVIFDVAVTPNRGDCLSHLGIAREVASALHQDLKYSKPKAINFEKGSSDIKLNSGEKAAQFLGCVIDDVRVGPSPQWVVNRLESLGSRSINNIVDATNLVLFELGQPTHAYDADLLNGNEMSVRLAQKGEELLLLDGDKIELRSNDLVIVDKDKPVALAGVMGGGNSEVNADTKKIFLECAEFSPTSVRKTAKFFQKNTEASFRFERGIDPLLPRLALARLVELICQFTGGKVVKASEAFLESRDPELKNFINKVEVEKSFFHKYLGVEIKEEEVVSTLSGLGCQVNSKEDTLRVTVPSYRRDLNIKEDLVEEVARCIGYDKIPATIPALSNSPVNWLDPSWLRLGLIDKSKDILAELGLNESVHFSFGSKSWLSEFGFDVSVPILNPLSEEQEVLVPSLLPGIIKSAIDNWNHHHGSEPLPIRIFEQRPTFSLEDSGEVRASSHLETGIKENWKTSFCIAGPRFADGLRNQLGEVGFYDLKAIIDRWLSRLGVRGSRVIPMMDSKNKESFSKLFHPMQSAELWIGKNPVGEFGLLYPGVAKKLKIRHSLWIAEFNWDLIAEMSDNFHASKKFRPWSECPTIERDFALTVKDGVSAQDLTRVAVSAGKPIAKLAKVFDIYRGSQVGKGMTSLAVRVIFSVEGRSLKESEADDASARILEKWKKQLDVELRS